MNYDSYDAHIGPAITATFNDYYRGELGVRFDRSYLMSAREAPDWAWDERHQQPNLGGKAPFPNTVVDLSQAMTLNPKMKVLVDSGYFDMACPYRTIEYAIDHLDVSPEVRKNVSIEYFQAGHMMYVEPESMKKFKDTLAAFVEANSR
jgi:carboxypeptidase C (cathepsin A)